MRALDHDICWISISLSTKVRLYNVYILPVLLYGADARSMTVAAWRRLDAFDQRCLWHILRIPYTAHVSNLTVRKWTNQHRVTSTILDQHLELFGHICWADKSHNRAWALWVSTNHLPEGWRHPSSRPRQSWLWTIKGELRLTQNIALSSAWHITHRRSHRHRVEETAVVQEEQETWQCQWQRRWWWRC